MRADAVKVLTSDSMEGVGMSNEPELTYGVVSRDGSPYVPVEPFLKWPGGKRWIAQEIAQYIRPRLYGRYFEPFLGSAAVFFALRPRVATLSDINSDLINTYKQVRGNDREIVKLLKRIPVNQDTYYTIRERKCICSVERAVRFLYLNRTGFSGMYRLNRQGEFNVPFGGGGRTPKRLWEKDLLRRAGCVLRNRRIVCNDFENVVAQADAGDVIYFDPTYTVAHNYNGFVRYNEANFSWQDQVRLAATAKTAYKKGVLVLVSNAGHESIAELYRPFVPLILERKSLISRNISHRVTIREYLFILDPNQGQ